ncbi:MAG: 50S ribosomal protein L3 [Patescibacteria group bacterium]
MKFAIGTKLEMSHMFNEEGRANAVTLVRVEPFTVTQIKTKDKDGYEAVQVAAGSKKHLTKPLQGHLKKANLQSARWMREFRINGKWQMANGESQMAIGKKLDASLFEKGDMVQVSGVVKGRGFQGVVKRHGFHGAPATHGTKHAHREPGSIGSTGPQKVAKGRRMGGRMGGKRVTIKNLIIADVLAEKNLLVLTGAVPGHRGSLLEIRGK